LASPSRSASSSRSQGRSLKVAPSTATASTCTSTPAATLSPAARSRSWWPTTRVSQTLGLPRPSSWSRATRSRYSWVSHPHQCVWPLRRTLKTRTSPLFRAPTAAPAP